MGNIMKKWKGILAVILITGCLGGCSQFQAEHNAVKVKRDGSVQAAVIDTLDKSYYSEDELKQTIDDSVSAYNQSQEGDPIVVKKFNVTDGKAELYMNYAASRDYQDFNNVTFYAGDLQGAYNQKYEFPDEFQKVENGKVTGSVTRSDILSGLNYNVVICSEEMDIEVPGKILYVTTDAVVTGKKTATSISEEREKAAESETETASESESTDGGSKSDGNEEKGQFEVESESKSAAGNEASDTADDAEEIKHTLTFVIYE